MIKVLHYSPHAEDDGIAKYQEQYLQSMESSLEVENKFFETSPLKFRKMNESEKENVLKNLRKELKSFDILHIQHEFGLYEFDDFQRVVDAGKRAGAAVVVSVHLSPDFAIKPVKLGGLGPRSIVNHARKIKHKKLMHERHLKPMIAADMLLVHNDITMHALEKAGVDKAKIRKIIHPVYSFPEPPKTSHVSQQLNKKEGDVIYCTVGMLHKYKGIFDAVKALKFLPDNYKLAIIGGMNPFSDEVPIYNKICDLIDTLGLTDRVYITGFVKDDQEMNSFIRECDVCVFPYDGTYYANLSSGSINLGFSNSMPVIAYPTAGFVELSKSADGAVKLCDTFAYYELARELQRIDMTEQSIRSTSYAKKMAWPIMAQELIDTYKSIS